MSYISGYSISFLSRIALSRSIYSYSSWFSIQLKVFGELGFSVAHRFTHTHEDSCGSQSFNLKCENGFAVDITNVPPEEPVNGRDRVIIRMNVRDFEGTCELLRAHGFTQCTPLIDQEHVTSMTMQAPSGFRIAVIYHKRKQK